MLAGMKFIIMMARFGTYVLPEFATEHPVEVVELRSVNLLHYIVGIGGVKDIY